MWKIFTKEHNPFARILKGGVKEVTDETLNYFKKKMAGAGGNVVGSGVFGLALVVILILIFFFLNLTLAVYLGSILGNYWKGFGVVTAFYILIAICLIILKNKIKRSVSQSLAKKIIS